MRPYRHAHHEHVPHGLRQYVNARMHRRLFVWFGLAILAAAATAAGTMHLVGRTGGGGIRNWNLERARLATFVGGRFARVWNSPVERDELASAMARELDLGVRLTDMSGNALASVSFPPRCRWRMALPVPTALGPEGLVEICGDRHHAPPPPGLLLVAVLAACAMLWAIAGRVARRIAQPLGQLTRVAREIGEGNLSSRAALCGWRRNDEIGALGEAVNEMAERLERQLKDQRELLATVSHELRTPLTRIRLLLELAEGSGADPKMLREVDAEIVEMDKLVGELLAGARVDFHALAPRAVDAVEIARRAVERAALEGSTVDASDDAGTLMADPTLLARALAALLDNAKKYGAPPVVVRVHPTDDGRAVAFDVDDAGAGFAAGDEERLMTAFARGRDTAPDDARGIGLGLSLVRRIAEAHGGRAYARTLPGGGARVAIEIPREPRARRPA